MALGVNHVVPHWPGPLPQGGWCAPFTRARGWREGASCARRRDAGSRSSPTRRPPGQLGEMRQRARRLLATDHHEMVLVPVQPSDERNVRFARSRRRLEYVPRQRHGRPQYVVELRKVVASQAAQRGSGSRRARQSSGKSRHDTLGDRTWRFSDISIQLSLSDMLRPALCSQASVCKPCCHYVSWH